MTNPDVAYGQTTLPAGIRSRFVAAFARLARELRGEDGVLGYDAFNEPSCEIQRAPCGLPPDAAAGERWLKPFYDELVTFITSGPVVVARVSGENAIGVWRELMGPTDPADAPAGTIRGDFASVITENVVHGSDSPESGSISSISACRPLRVSEARPEMKLVSLTEFARTAASDLSMEGSARLKISSVEFAGACFC